MYTRKEFPPPASARPLSSPPPPFLKCFQIVKHALGVVLVSFALPILLGGSPATAQENPSDTSQSDTIADLQARLDQALDERKNAQTVFEEARAESDKADADYAVAREAYKQAQDAFEVLKNDPDRDPVAFREARATRNTARDTMVTARATRNTARDTMVTARDARNSASTQVQDLRTELAKAQAAEEQAPVLALERQIEELIEEVSSLNDRIEVADAAVVAAAKDLLEAEQQVTAAEQQATDAEQRVTVAEQETAEAGEQVADLELNLYEAHGGCRLDGIAKDGETVYRTETNNYMCVPNSLIYIETCYPSHTSNIRGLHYSLKIIRGEYILYRPNKPSSHGIDFAANFGNSIEKVEINLSREFFEVHLVGNKGQIDIDFDGTIDNEISISDEYLASLLILKDRILAIVDGEITENPLPICE